MKLPKGLQEAVRIAHKEVTAMGFELVGYDGNTHLVYVHKETKETIRAPSSPGTPHTHVEAMKRKARHASGNVKNMDRKERKKRSHAAPSHPRHNTKQERKQRIEDVQQYAQSMGIHIPRGTADYLLDKMGGVINTKHYIRQVHRAKVRQAATDAAREITDERW